MATARVPAPGGNSLLTPACVRPGMLSKTLLREFPRAPSCRYITPGLVRPWVAGTPLLGSRRVLLQLRAVPVQGVAGLAGICLLLE